MSETYAPSNDRLLRCPLAGCVGRDDPDASAEEVEGWAKKTTGPFELWTFPGNHFFLIPHAEQVLARLMRWIDIAELRALSATP